MHELPKRAYFLAGMVKANTELSLGVILKFLDILYSSDIGATAMGLIEAQLALGKIGAAKELFDKSAKICSICTKKSLNPTTLPCSHTFHKECLLTNLTTQVKSQETLVCPICYCEIPNLSKISPEISLQNNDYKLSKYLSQPNITKCPNCSEIFQVDIHEIISCLICSVAFCSECRKLEKDCSCQKICIMCNKAGNSESICKDCKITHDF